MGGERGRSREQRTGPNLPAGGPTALRIRMPSREAGRSFNSAKRNQASDKIRLVLWPHSEPFTLGILGTPWRAPREDLSVGSCASEVKVRPRKEQSLDGRTTFSCTALRTYRGDALSAGLRQLPYTLWHAARRDRRRSEGRRRGLPRRALACAHDSELLLCRGSAGQFRGHPAHPLLLSAQLAQLWWLPPRARPRRVRAPQASRPGRR